MALRFRRRSSPSLSRNVDDSTVFVPASLKNAGKVSTQGVDLGVSYFLSRDWKASFTYSWFDFEIREAVLTQQLLPNSPPNKLAAAVDYTVWRRSPAHFHFQPSPKGSSQRHAPCSSLAVALMGSGRNLETPVRDEKEGQIRVAVVDDDVSLCKALCRLLSAWDMRAVTYPSAEAFLEDTRRPNVECLILDIQLGGMSGFDLQARLRETGVRVPVIFITAHDAPETRELALSTGAAYVRKAEPGVVLREAILRAVER